MNRRQVRFFSALGVFLGSSIALFGYYGTETACMCPSNIACSCPRPLLAYFLGYLGGAIATISAAALILSFAKPKTTKSGTAS